LPLQKIAYLSQTDGSICPDSALLKENIYQILSAFDFKNMNIPAHLLPVTAQSVLALRRLNYCNLISVQ